MQELVNVNLKVIAFICIGLFIYTVYSTLKAILQYKMEMRELDSAYKAEQVSACCSSETIPPDWEMADQMGSLWRAYACHICKKCGKACEVVSKKPFWRRKFKFDKTLFVLVFGYILIITIGFIFSGNPNLCKDF